jgi:hypothetical protein
MVVPVGNAPASPAYQAGALLLSYGTKKGAATQLWCNMAATVDSIQERHLAHGPRSGLGVHQHPMPHGQRDRAVIRMPDLPARIHRCVPLHPTPTPPTSRRILAQQLAILAFEHPVRVMAADVNLHASFPVQLFDEVRLAASAPNGFVAEDAFRIRVETRQGDEEPLTLAAERPVVPGMPLASGETRFGFIFGTMRTGLRRAKRGLDSHQHRTA